MLYYVYLYRDPRDDQPFYVGKGYGRRDRYHLRETADNTENPRKHHRIVDIRSAGLEPVIERVGENLDEQAAYALEVQTILQYGRIGIDPEGILTNRNLGGANSGPSLLKVISPEDLVTVLDHSANIREIASKYKVSIGSVYNLRPTRNLRCIPEEMKEEIRNCPLTSAKDVAKMFGINDQTVRNIRGSVYGRGKHPRKVNQ